MQNTQQLKKAHSLGDILKAFKNEPLKSTEELDLFFYKDTMAIRTGDPYSSPLRALFDACNMPSDNNAHLLLGHRGSGKTTELYNLKRKLETETNKLVYMIDARLETDLNKISCWDILLLITEGLLKIAESKGIEIPENLIDNIFFALYDTTETIKNRNDLETSLEVGAQVQANPVPILSKLLNAFVNTKVNAKSSITKNQEMKVTLEKRASEWIIYTTQVANIITSKCDLNQPVIIFEGLDKVHANYNVIEIFKYSVLANMPFPIIYTFPISQSHAPSFATISDMYTCHIMPMIKVSNIDNSTNKDGIDIIKKIVEQRADTTLFDNDVLDTLISKTGGSLRDLFTCIVNAARRAAWRYEDTKKDNLITIEDIDVSLANYRQELSRRIEKDDYPILVSIFKDTNRRTGIEKKDALLKYLEAHIVLEYKNGERWHNVHPLIVDFLINQGEFDDTLN